MNKCLLINRLSLSLLTTSLIALSSCAKQENHSSGGVDGSGGNLEYIDANSFADWIATDHKYYVRDTIHRLEQIRKFSPSFEHYPNSLPLRFLGAKEGDLQKVADGLTYYSVPGACPASNHPASDSSVNADGRICFSYSAFKNLGALESIKKLLSMTMHELGHLRGFNEDEATAWQLAFTRTSVGLGTETILFQNFDFRIAKETLSKISQRAAFAMEFILRQDDESKIDACNSLIEANGRVEDFFYYGQVLPVYLQTEVLENGISKFLGLAATDCEKKPSQQLADEVAFLLEKLSTLAKDLENYESPICTGNVCAGTRFTRGYVETALLEWQAKKSLFSESKKYPTIAAEKVRCHLRDLTAIKDVPLTKNEYGGFQLGEYKSDVLRDIKIGYEGTIEEGHIQFEHNGSVVLQETSGFIAAPFRIEGLVFPGEKHQIHAVFTVVDPHLRPPVKHEGEIFETTDIPYSARDPFFMAIGQEPTPLNSFRLECEI